MAYFGLSLIEAINEVLESVGEPPWGQTDHPSEAGDSTSIARRAEDFLNRETLRVQSLGWPENTIVSLKLTTDGTDTTTIYLQDAKHEKGFDILALKGAGTDSHRNYGMRGFKLWDADNGTDTFTTATEVFLTVAKTVADPSTATFWPDNFESCSPQLKDLVVANTKVIFQRRIQGSAQSDGALQHEWMNTEVNTPRNAPVTSPSPMNIRPTMANPSAIRPAGYNTAAPARGRAFPGQRG